MHVIIVGGGEVGSYIARVLSEEQQDVYMIEQSERLARELDEKLDARVIQGTGISRRTLQRAGIERADLLLAVTQVDEVNLVAAMTGDKLNPDCRTVARVRDTRFLRGTDALRAEEYGIDFLVSPEEAVANQVVQLLMYRGPGQVSNLANGQVALMELPVMPHSTLPYITCGEFAAALPSHSHVVAILDESGLRIAQAQDRLHVGQRAFVLGAPGELNEILSLAGSDIQHIKRVLLIGGGFIGARVGGALQGLRFDVTLVEKDAQRAEELATTLHKIRVIHGDGTDPVLIQDHVREGHEAVVVLPEEDSTALLIGILAKHFGAKKVIARVDSNSYAPIAHKLGIDALISPQRAMADSILQFTRHGQITSTTMLGDHQGEILDFRIDARSNPKLTQEPLKDIKIPANSLIAVIVRDGEILLPRLDESARLKLGDHVFVVGLRDAVPRLEALFG
jgi:trk system potassium uptake protein TrkA